MVLEQLLTVVEHRTALTLGPASQHPQDSIRGAWTPRGALHWPGPNSVPAPPQELQANDSAPCSNPTQALGKHPSPSCPLCTSCSRPWRALGAQAPRAGEAHRPEPPSSPCTTLRALQPRESTTSGLRMSRAGSRAISRPESATGTPIWFSPAKRRRGACVPGEPRRPPHARSVLAARSRVDGRD